MRACRSASAEERTGGGAGGAGVAQVRPRPSAEIQGWAPVDRRGASAAMGGVRAQQWAGAQHAQHSHSAALPPTRGGADASSQHS